MSSTRSRPQTDARSPIVLQCGIDAYERDADEGAAYESEVSVQTGTKPEESAVRCERTLVLEQK